MKISGCSDAAVQSESRGLIARIVPAAVAAAEASIADYAADLFPEEAAGVAKAVERRRLEFSTGRMLARRALRAAGGPQVAIPIAAHRGPVWPAGFVGSITHTASHAAAAVGRVEAFAGIGIDIEIISRVSSSLARMIATQGEREALRAAAEPARQLALTYSAKESWFKCQYPLTQTFIDFHDVEILIDWSGGTFEVRASALDPRVHPRGRFAIDDDLVATAIVLSASEPK